jgi:hypothetical protein
MKSSIQIFASLVAALATLSQSAIATPRTRVMSQNAIDLYQLPIRKPQLPGKIELQLPSLIVQQLSLLKAEKKSPSNTDLIRDILKDLSRNDLVEKCSINQVDLNSDGKKEVFIRRIDEYCGGAGRCSIWIGKNQGNKFESVLDGISTSPDFAVLNTKTKGWKDVATRSYLGEESWTIWKFDGSEYKVVSSRKINSIPVKQISKSSPCSEVISK